jgi:D-sedoheptulose 7-phosphate isomerase
LTTVGFTGMGGGRLASFSDHLFAVASRDTARIQEAHILAGHMLCDWIELDVLGQLPSQSAAANETRALAKGAR